MLIIIMLGEAQLYIHAESTALVMLPAPTSKMLERVVRATAKAWARTWSRTWSRAYARTWAYTRVPAI